MSSTVLKLAENTKGRDFVVGDIHGCFHLLDQALEKVHFDPACDRLISVGDLISRGPEPQRCIEFLKQPWFFAIRGNHEDMFLRSINSGGIPDPRYYDWHMKEGFNWVHQETIFVLMDAYDAFAKLPLAIELETKEGKIGITHGDVPGKMNWETFKKKLEKNDQKTVFKCLWGRDRVKRKSERGIKEIARVYFGHTPQTDGVTKLGNCFFIDTGAVYSLHPKNKKNYCLTLVEATADPKDILRRHTEQVNVIAKRLTP